MHGIGERLVKSETLRTSEQTANSFMPEPMESPELTKSNTYHAQWVMAGHKKYSLKEYS